MKAYNDIGNATSRFMKMFFFFLRSCGAEVYSVHGSVAGP